MSRSRVAKLEAMLARVQRQRRAGPSRAALPSAAEPARPGEHTPAALNGRSRALAQPESALPESALPESALLESTEPAIDLEGPVSEADFEVDLDAVDLVTEPPPAAATPAVEPARPQRGMGAPAASLEPAATPAAAPPKTGATVQGEAADADRATLLEQPEPIPLSAPKGGPVARVVARPQPLAQLTFGELVSGALSLRPTSDEE